MDDFQTRRDVISKAELRALTQRSNWRGAVQTISHFGAIGLTGWALWALWGTWWAVPLFVLHGTLINFLFAAQHEYNHYTVFDRRWLNDVFNRITGFILFYPRDYERWFHYEHHRFTQDWERDPELLAREPYRLVRYLIYLFGVSYWLARWRVIAMNAMGKVPNPYFTAPQKRAVVREARWHWAGYGLVGAASVFFDSWLAVQLWIAPMLATKVFHMVQNITEHTGVSHEDNTLHNTRTIKTWAVLRWMAWNMQYHTAHHTYPAVPFHKLPQLHRLIVERLGYEPPTIGYIAFQWQFIRALMKAPESKQGAVEVRIPERAPETSAA